MPTWLKDWFETTVVDLKRQFRWSFLPPLMVYFAAGVSGLAGIVGTFFVKEYLGLSAAFLAGLAFWAGLPWALKMPIGHLVDVIWRWKAALVYLGAGLIASSMLIMYGLISSPDAMSQVMRIEAWYVLSALLSPCGYVVQDAVADAMSVEAVPKIDDAGNPLDDDTQKGPAHDIADARPHCPHFRPGGGCTDQHHHVCRHRGDGPNGENCSVSAHLSAGADCPLDFGVRCDPGKCPEVAGA